MKSQTLEQAEAFYLANRDRIYNEYLQILIEDYPYNADQTMVLFDGFCVCLQPKDASNYSGEELYNEIAFIDLFHLIEEDDSSNALFSVKAIVPFAYVMVFFNYFCGRLLDELGLDFTVAEPMLMRI